MLEAILLTTLSIISVLLILMARQLVGAFGKYRQTPLQLKAARSVSSSELPSVTVCIPARNEQHALTDSLLRLLSSTYEKLEIIVLDDVSGDDTSALIKSFANEGVRFVSGTKLKQGWLGKNHALQGLLNEASGSYIFYMGVDTMLAPNAIENMVRYAVANKASMVSVLPRREDRLRMSIIASPLRYFWELLFARNQRPASSSCAWLIRRDVLQDRFGGFENYKNTVQPETGMAAELAALGEYRFLVGSKQLGVSYEKKWSSQVSTSVRILSPLLGNQLTMALFAIIDLLAIFILPFAITIFGLLGFLPLPITVFAGAVSVGFMALYTYYARQVWQSGWLLAGIIWPFVVLQEAVLIAVSYVQHSRGKVKWKGRLIQPEVQS